MKRYLLSLIALACAVTGAWAADAEITGTEGNSLVTITTNDDADLSALTSSTALSGNWGSNTASENGIKVVGTISQTGLDVIQTMMSGNTAMYYGADKFLDLSQATFSGDITSLPSGVSTAEYATETKFVSCVLPAGSEIPGTIPDGYKYVYSPCTSGGPIRIYVNSSDVSIPELTDEQISSASQIVVTGSAAADFKNTLSEAAQQKLPFDGSMAVTTTGTENVQQKVEAFLKAKGEISESPSDEEMATALATITSLTITGPLTSADLTYLGSLSGLTSLNLVNVSSFGDGVSKSSIGSSVATGAEVVYPTLLVSNADGLTTITVLEQGGATAEALAAKGVTNNNTGATIKIVGDVSTADITNIVALSNSGWSTRRLDLGEAQVTGSIPRLSGGADNAPYDAYYIILPGGSTVSDDDVTYAEQNSYDQNGIYNGYGDLKYVIVPAESGEEATLYINKTKDGNFPIVSDLVTYDKALFTGSESKIKVIPLNGAEDVEGWDNLITTLKNNQTWGTLIDYEEPAAPVAEDEIVINVENGGDLAAAITAKGETEIHKVVITGGTLSSDDITALAALSSVTTLDLSGATNAAAVTVPSGVTDLVVPAGVTIPAEKRSAATSLTYIYSVASDSYPSTVQVLQPGGFADAVGNHEALKEGKVKITGTINATDVNFNTLLTAESGKTIDLSETSLESTLIPNITLPGSNSGATPANLILPSTANLSAFPYLNSQENSQGNELGSVLKYADATTLEVVAVKVAALSLDAATLNGRTTLKIVGNDNVQNKVNDDLVSLINSADASLTAVDFSAIPSAFDTANLTSSTLTLTNTNITTVNLAGVSAAALKVDVSGCTGLTTLTLDGATLSDVDAHGTALATLGTNSSTTVGALNLASTKLTTFDSSAFIKGDITLNATSTLTSIDLSGATFTTATSMIHIDKDAENESNTAVIEALKVAGTKTIRLPKDFGADSRVHPYTEAADYIEEVNPAASPVTYASSDMVFHDAETTGETPDKFRYWYQGEMQDKQAVTIGLTAERTLNDVIAGNATIDPAVEAHSDLTSESHAIVKVIGKLTAGSIDSLRYLNCTMLDLSEAEIATGLLKTKLEAGNILNANTRFLVLPDTCTREHIVNGTTLRKLANVYSVIAVSTTEQGRDLTSWSRVAGALQPAVVGALSHSCSSWTTTPDGKTARNIYTSDVATFRAVKISGLINTYDLSHNGEAGQAVDANGHLVRTDTYEEVGKAFSATWFGGDYHVFGPFTASFGLTEIDLKGARFEQREGSSRYYCSDMTLSALNLITMSTYKVVLPTDTTVVEIPADFMNCATAIRAICIPSNIKAIRTRAFYTIDYVWTTPNAKVALDPEGSNTKLDNGAKVKKKDGTEYEAISALLIDENGQYKENPAFTGDYYVGNYETQAGGGTYTFGSNIMLIETAAFANTQPNVTDVYVLNTVAPECHVDAFNTVMYTGNNGYSPITDGQKIITRENYYNGRWITMLHYPRQTTTPNVQRYTDPTRSYSIATGMRDGKGAPLYFPNQSEFIRAYQQGTYGYIWNAWNPAREYGSVDNGSLTDTTSPWKADNQTAANSLFDAYAQGVSHEYTTFYKVNYDGVTAPTNSMVPYYQINWDESNYSTVEKGNLYPQSEVDQNQDADKSGEVTEKDYRGWHQFVLMAYAANTILEEEPHRLYVTDNDWWTYCPPFDLTKKQVMELFGSESTTNLPYVSRLLYVRREYEDNTIWLNFSNNLMVYKEGRTVSQPAENQVVPQHGQTDDNGIVTVSETENSVADGDVVMSAGVPYLIKPFREQVNGYYITQFRVYKSESEAAKQAESSGVKKIVDADLYAKMQTANTLPGAEQISQVETGLYTVPVFVKGDAQEGTTKENVDNQSYTIDNTEGYNKSTDWTYTFVGSHYLSPLPQYCYYLGKTATTGVTFIYNNYSPYSNDVFRWVNETCIVCPTKSTSPSFHVTEASGQNPALWEINAKGQSHIGMGNTELEDDSFATSASGASGSRTNTYNMQFGAGPVTVSTETVGISEAPAGGQPADGKVYSLDGQQKSGSLNGLAKGIYIVNGKKYVVK